MTSALDYSVGAIKDNGGSGVSRMVAIRTSYDNNGQWFYMSTNNGGGYVSHEVVSGWSDYVENNGDRSEQSVGDLKSKITNGDKFLAIMGDPNTPRNPGMDWLVYLPGIGGTWQSHEQVSEWSNV